MSFKPKSEFLAKRSARTQGDYRLWDIEEQIDGKVVRTFVGEVSNSQSERPDGQAAIERWCELRSDKLPSNSGKVRINLNEVSVEPMGGSVKETA
jgi:hypothetical protein